MWPETQSFTLGYLLKRSLIRRASVCIQDNTIRQEGRKLIRSGESHGGRLEHIDLVNRPPDHSLAQVTHKSFNFGNFSHD